MRLVVYTFVLLAGLCVSPQPASAQIAPANCTAPREFMMYHDNKTYKERVKDQTALAVFLSGVADAACQARIAATDIGKDYLDIVIIMKPGLQAKFWLMPHVSKTKDLPALSQKLSQVKVPEVTQPIIIGMRQSTTGKAPPRDKTMSSFPYQWGEAIVKAGGEKASLDDIITQVWP